MIPEFAFAGARFHGKSLEAACAAFVREIQARDLYPEQFAFQRPACDPVTQIDGAPFIQFISNNYFGLSSHPAVLRGAQEALLLWGTGPSGSRWLGANIEILETLESELAHWLGVDDVVTFPSGYMANLAVVNALLDPLVGQLPVQKGTGIVFCDTNNHGSILQAIRLSSAKCIFFRHNDPEDLERKLKRHRGPARLVMTEGVFSMEGELGVIPELLQLCHRHDVLLFVDDAHGVGVLGATGAGAMERFGLHGQADILMGSLDKAFGNMGGFLAGSKDLIAYLRIASRPYVFSSSYPAVLAGATLAALEIIAGDDGADRRRRLFENAARMREGLRQLGYKILGNGEVPTVPVLLGPEEKAIQVSRALFERGIIATCTRWPAAPKGKARIRLVPMATHQSEHIDALLSAMGDVKKTIGGES